MPRPPSRGAAGDPYGWRIHPVTGVRKFHYGDDTLGEGNFAPISGTVTYAGWHGPSGFGYAVSIREDGHRDKPVWTVAHHARVDVRVGQKVVEGSTYLGPKGTSGTSTGPHAHTERRTGSNGTPLSGTPSNPRSYYTTTAGGGASGIPQEEDDDMIFIRSKGDGAYAKGGYIYRLVQGSWFAVTNLEGNVLVPKLVEKGAVVHDFDVNEIEILFATDGLWEQEPAPVATWGGSATPLKGLGRRTGRIIYPGASPVDVNPEFQIPADLVAQITEAVPSVPEIAQGVRDELIAPDA